ncbi:hypothetical protein [uncultured Mediterranean phage]|nr:hypothetical protein [uncultured Mediterranean phage]
MSTDDIEDKASLPKFERLGYKDQVLDIINSLKLSSETDKHILKSRFLYEVLNYDARRNHTKKYYNGFRFVVTVGSILLPAILSIGQMDPAKLPKNFDSVTYWGAWSISLMVTVSNGFLQLFSLDKNYFEFALTSEQLKTEGWQFFQLSGKYDDYEDHKEAYRPFCKSIENIKRKQVEKEFSGKGESKKKKEFDFAKELKKNLPDQYENKQLQSGSGQSAPPSEASILSLLGKIAPDKVKEVAETMATETMATETIGKVEESVKEGVKAADELTYPTAT